MAFLLFDRRPRVALLRLAGLITARPPGPFAAGTLSAEGVGPLLERAFGLRRLAAVVIVVNSPGGSPVQASLIGARIRDLAERKKLPVIAVAEDAAASGGYWIACAAEEIVADPASIIGSIGVIRAGFGFAEAIGRIGVERRIRTAGAEKAFLDPFRPETEAERARLDEILAALHAEFIAWVKARRGGRLKAPDSVLFSGRFWTGREALDLGLIDSLGSAEATIRARFGEKANILRLGPRRPPLLARLFGGGAAALLAAAEERAAWARLGL